MEEAGVANPIIGQEYCIHQAAQFRVTKEDVSDSNGELVFQVHKKSIFSKSKRELQRDGRPVVLLERNRMGLFDWNFRAYSAPDFKAQQPLWTVKKKVSLLDGISFHIFLSSNVNQQMPDYTIKGHSRLRFHKKYSIFLGETQLAAEVTREASNMFTTNYKYNVVVQPTMDMAFISSLVIILDILSKESNTPAPAPAPAPAM